MGLFSDLMGKIFHGARPAETSPGRPAAGTRPSVSEEASRGPSPAPQPAAPAPVDVAAILDGMASASPQKLDWKHSIVDLMKLVGMDSSLDARRELAADLQYSGDTADTAKMNMWLHKEVMKKLAENGGKVPQELMAR